MADGLELAVGTGYADFAWRHFRLMQNRYNRQMRASIPMSSEDAVKASVAGVE